MDVISKEIVSPQKGWTGNVDKGQVLRITGRSVIDFNAFIYDDIREYYDTARTIIRHKSVAFKNFYMAGQRTF